MPINLATVLKVFAMPDNSKSAIVQGIARVKILDYIEEDPYFKAAVSKISDDPISDELEISSISDNLRKSFSELIKVAPNLTEEHTVCYLTYKNQIDLLIGRYH